MKRFALIAALGASCLAIAACSRDDAATNNAYDNVAAGDAVGGAEGADANGASASGGTAFPKGARIVEEKGVTYRIDADGTRVALTEKDSRIVVEGDKRYRVDPDGTRVRIDDRGIDLGFDVDAPDVDVGINDKGNPDIDVKDKGDNNAGPD